MKNNMRNYGLMGAAAYSRPDKPRHAQRPDTSRIDEDLVLDCGSKIEVLTIEASSECHVTPTEVAKEMTHYASVVADVETANVLEPSFGTGQILRELLKSDWASVTGVERHWKLAESVISNPEFQRAKLYNDDFLDFEDHFHLFDVICMNPPFKAVVKHMQTAYDLLVKGGIIIAIVPLSYNESKLKGKCNFLQLRTLPESTFVTAKVSTQLVEILKIG